MKPLRQCPVCKVWQSRLSRHISTVHKSETRVKEILNTSTTSTQRTEQLAVFRKEGIFNENVFQATQPEPTYQRERKGLSALSCCSRCKGFYSRNQFHKHKELCKGNTDDILSSVRVEAFKTMGAVEDEFTTEILAKFQNDDIGKLCRSEPTIVLIGRRRFQRNRGKVDKLMEIKKSVMTEMRLLSKLCIAFSEAATGSNISAKDMFVRTNFNFLEVAIERVTTAESSALKHGVKNGLYYLLKNSATIVMSSYLGDGDDNNAAEVEKFIHYLELNRDTVFADAVYAINKSRQERLRMPEQRADEKQVIALKMHTEQRIKALSDAYEIVTRKTYIELRDAICSRLTLFNARRGGEPSRLKLKNWLDAVNGRWIDESRVEKMEEFERELFKSMLIAYQTGKGNHLVPVLIPRDCVSGLNTLTDHHVRKEVGILEGNPYVFPNTEHSQFHVLGWNTTRKMCENANVENPELLTASKQRHRISTIYAALDVPEGEREHFYKHMGHSKSVNLGTYQYPLPLLEMTKVGRHLQNIDEGIYNNELFIIF